MSINPKLRRNPLRSIIIACLVMAIHSSESHKYYKCESFYPGTGTTRGEPRPDACLKYNRLQDKTF